MGKLAFCGLPFWAGVANFAVVGGLGSVHSLPPFIQQLADDGDVGATIRQIAVRADSSPHICWTCCSNGQIAI
jgi:hypothetical protein